MFTCPSCSCVVNAEEVSCPDCGETLADNAHTTIIQSDDLPPRAKSSQAKTSGRISPGTLISDRIRIMDLLGKGGMGEVYRAEDIQLERQIALKFLPAEFTQNADRVSRFIQEARTVSSLNHPNIVTIHEIGESPVGRYIVMELVAGQSLRAFEKPCEVDQIISITEQVAKALAATHDAGITHRDIKPDNIMVRDDGYVKVLDFGLARLNPSHNSEAATVIHQTMPGTLLGTVAYMSPEQTRGEEVGPASDIFALGIVLYELATAQHPFKAYTVFGLLQAISLQPVTPVQNLNNSLPQPFAMLLQRMLEKDPHKRPTAAEVVKALHGAGKAGVVDESNLSISAPLPTFHIQPPAIHIVGQEKERSILMSTFQAVSAGRGAMVCVTGEPGIGKSTLIEKFLSDTLNHEQHCLLARGRCSEQLAGAEAYLPFWEALQYLQQHDSNGMLIQLMRQVAPTWYAQIIPASNEDSAARLAESRAPSQERLKREMVLLLQEYARRQPVILFIDDVHWADFSTTDLLSYLASQCDDVRLLFIVTYRPSELLMAKHPFLQIKLDLQGRGFCREVQMEFLGLPEIEQYFDQRFPGHRFPADLSQLIFDRTEGNGLFMSDLVDYLRDHQIISEVEGRWELAQAIPDFERELPESIKSMVERKISLLSEEQRKLLITASVQGYEFDSAVVAQALALDAAEVEDQLDELDQIFSLVKLINERPFPNGELSVRYRFVHALYQNELYARLRPTRRAQMSGAVANTLLAFYGQEKVAEVASSLAILFETARDFPKAADFFTLAAQNAARVFAYQETATLAQRGLKALQFLPAGLARDQKELSLQMLLGLSLMPIKTFLAPEVMEAYNRARELCQQFPESPDLIKVLHGLWMAFVMRAEHVIAAEIADRLVRLSKQTHNPGLQARMQAVRGFSADYMGEFQLARESYETALQLYDPKLERAFIHQFGSDSRVMVLSRFSWVLLVLGFPAQARQMLEDCLTACHSIKHPFSEANALLSLPQTFIELGEPEKALAIAEAARALATEHGFPLNLAYANMHRGFARAKLGKLDEGIAEMQQNFAMLRAIGTEMSLNGYSVDIAELLGAAGRIDEALAAVTEAINRAEHSKEGYFEAESYRVKGDLLLLAKASPDEVEGQYQLALEIARRRSALMHELRAAMGLARLWQAQQKTEPAHKLLQEVFNRFTEGFESPDLKHARVLLAELTTGEKHHVINSLD